MASCLNVSNPCWQDGAQAIYCAMRIDQILNTWFNPKAHLILSILISLVTSLVAFRSVEMEPKTMQTFLSFYLVLALIVLVFIFQDKFSSERTRQLIQFSYFLLGTVLMTTSVISILGRDLSIAAVFILILFLPGIAIFRAGIHFKKVNRDA